MHGPLSPITSLLVIYVPPHWSVIDGMICLCPSFGVIRRRISVQKMTQSTVGQDIPMPAGFNLILTEDTSGSDTV